MFRKRRPGDSGTPGSNPDLGRCECVRYFPWDRPLDDSAAPSKEAESRGWGESTSRCLSSPKICPGLCERTHQASRGSGRIGSCLTRLTQAPQNCKDVKEKVEELVPMLERFRQNISVTTDGGDQAEKQRRSELSRCVHQSPIIPTLKNFSSGYLHEPDQDSNDGTTSRRSI